MCFLARLSDGGDGSSVIFRLTCSSNQSEILQLGCTGASSSIDTALETFLWANKGSAALRYPDRMFRNRDFSLFLAFTSRLLLHLQYIVFFPLQWHAVGCSCGIWQHFWPQHDLMLQISHGFFMCWQSPVVDVISKIQWICELFFPMR